MLSKYLDTATEGKQTASLVEKDQKEVDLVPQISMPRISKFSRKAVPQMEYYYSSQIVREKEKSRGTRVLITITLH